MCNIYVKIIYNLIIIFSDIGSLYVAQASLKLMILLPQAPEFWDYECSTMPRWESEKHN
jgi:hypothetical protein